MNIVLPSVQVFILVVFSSVFSLFVNGIRTDGIPLLAKELDVADNIKISVDEPQLLAISLEQALDLYNKGTVFVDAREPEYFTDGHIMGAWNVPFFFELTFKLDSLQGKDSPIVVYCSGDECGSSEDLAYELQAEGFTNLYVFKGGWTEWNENGHPIGP
jgi:rhodanese-related sulfurtransferase